MSLNINIIIYPLIQIDFLSCELNDACFPCLHKGNTPKSNRSSQKGKICMWAAADEQWTL